MEEFLEQLEVEFKSQSNVDIARSQKAYMKGQFEYFGMKSPTRRAIQKPFLVQAYLPPKKELAAYVKALWAKPQRDFHYVGQELAKKYLRKTEIQDIKLYEYMITHQSWWDTVDFIASTLVGHYFKVFPDKTAAYVDQWLASGNIWLQRTALIFQLKYKAEVDQGLLEKAIVTLLGGKEFFVNKAIGWSLRSYARVNPNWVLDFVDSHELSNLSKREALKHLLP